MRMGGRGLRPWRPPTRSLSPRTTSGGSCPPSPWPHPGAKGSGAKGDAMSSHRRGCVAPGSGVASEEGGEGRCRRGVERLRGTAGVDLHFESQAGKRSGTWVSAGVTGHHPLGREHPSKAGGREAERGNHREGAKRPGSRWPRAPPLHPTPRLGPGRPRVTADRGAFAALSVRGDRGPHGAAASR